jgi:cell division protein FtsQ
MRKVKVVSARGSLASKTRKTLHFGVRRPILLLSCALALTAGAYGIWRGGYIGDAADAARLSILRLTSRHGFAVRTITLSGQERTQPDSVYGTLAIARGDPMFAVDAEAARSRLVALPWVADAEVRRHFPDSVTVRLIEKRPFALWRSGDSLWVVERSGAVITAADRSEFPHLPLLLGEGAPDAAAAILDALPKQTAISARLEALERIGERRWDLHLANGVVVRLPEENWQYQLAELETLIVEKGVLERDIDVIDLRFPDNYVFKLRNGDSRPVPRERRA